MTSERVYKEAEITREFGEDFDLPKPEGEIPYRILMDWYITTTKDPQKRVALLPHKGDFAKNHVLHGTLQGSTSDVSPIHVQVPLADGSWAVDRGHDNTPGYWITSDADEKKGAWYWLKQCHPTQEETHYPMRALLGLLWNVMDCFMEEYKEESAYYLTNHLKLSPKELHRRLSCNNAAEFQQYTTASNEQGYPLFQEPFDYALFTSAGLTFCQAHLKGWFGGADTRFYKQLGKLKENNKKSWSAAEYKASAERAEERSQRTPWGELLPNAKRIRPNWNMDAKIGQQEVSDEEEEAPKKKKKAPAKRKGSKKEPAAKKQKTTGSRRRVVEDSSSDDDEDMFGGGDDVNMVDHFEQDRYSDERMRLALNQLKQLLTPEPADETGKWDDVIEKKFRVKDAKSAAEMTNMMRNSSNLSDECKLLLITAFLNVCLLETKGPGEKKLVSKLFREKVCGISIFEGWKQEAKATLDRLKDKPTEDSRWYQDIVAYRLLVAYIKFIKKCFVVNAKKTLDDLQEKRKVGWNQPDYLQDIEEFARKYAYESTDLRTGILLARKHLDRILKAEAPKNSSKDEPISKTATKTASTEALSASRAPNADAPARVLPSATASMDSSEQKALPLEKKKLDEEAERKKKRDDERRQKLLLQMKSKTANVVASQQAKPTFQSTSRDSVKPSRDSVKPPQQRPTTETLSAPAPSKSNWNKLVKKREPVEPNWAPCTAEQLLFLRPVGPPGESKQTSRPSERGGDSRLSRGNDRSDQPRENDSRGFQDDRRSDDRSRRDSGRFEDSSSRSQSFERRQSDSRRYDRGSDQRSVDYSRDRDSRRDGDFRRDRNERDSYRGDHRPRDHSTDRERSYDRSDSRSANDGRVTDRTQDRRFDVGGNETGGFDGRGGGNHMTAPSGQTGGQQPVFLQAVYQQQPTVQQTVAPQQPAFQPQQPVVQQPLQPVVQQQVAGDTSARGRGRGRTLPAWMTNGTSNGPSSQGGSVPLPANNATMSAIGAPGVTQVQNAVATSAASQPASLTNDDLKSILQPMGVQQQVAPQQPVVQQPLPPVAQQQVAGDTSSRGRGRGRTLPAWMTNGTSNGPTSQGGYVALPAGNATQVQAQRTVPPSASSHQVPLANVGHQPSSGGGGRGRGRGQHMTKPAWMTRGES